MSARGILVGPVGPEACLVPEALRAFRQTAIFHEVGAAGAAPEVRLLALLATIPAGGLAYIYMFSAGGRVLPQALAACAAHGARLICCDCVYTPAGARRLARAASAGCIPAIDFLGTSARPTGLAEAIESRDAGALLRRELPQPWAAGAGNGTTVALKTRVRGVEATQHWHRTSGLYGPTSVRVIEALSPPMRVSVPRGLTWMVKDPGMPGVQHSIAPYAMATLLDDMESGTMASGLTEVSGGSESEGALAGR
jgi:hypothetical protein